MEPRDRRMIARHLARREAVRAALGEAARLLRRRAQRAMAQRHAGATALADLRAIRIDVRRLARRVRALSPEDGGLVHDALQEGIEALALEAILRGQPAPALRELGVPPEAYLAGLADVVGELRRSVLDALREGKGAVAEARFERMEELVRVLLGFESPRSVLALKPKQDAARAILERTRGDLVLARYAAHVAADREEP